MTISININITLDPADIITLLQQLTTPPAPASAELVEAKPIEAKPIEAKPVEAQPARTFHLGAHTAPRSLPPRTKGNRAPKRPATAAPQKATPDPEEDTDRKRPPFDQLDPLVRSEIKRLAMDGRVPNAKLWDSERDPRLPTLGAVMLRYNTRGLVEFAAAMGMEPPLSAMRYTNGAQPVPATE